MAGDKGEWVKVEGNPWKLVGLEAVRVLAYQTGYGGSTCKTCGAWNDRTGDGLRCLTQSGAWPALEAVLRHAYPRIAGILERFRTVSDEGSAWSDLYAELERAIEEER